MTVSTQVAGATAYVGNLFSVPASRRPSPRFAAFFVAVTVVFVVIYVSFNDITYSVQHTKWPGFSKPPPRPELPPPPPMGDEYVRGMELHDPRCAAFPDRGNVVIGVKTGATEAHKKIPTQMLTSLRCAHNVIIYSDMEQDVAGFHVHDSLDAVPKSAMEGNSDFDFYLRQKELKKHGEIEMMMDGVKDPRMSNDLAAWTLDKYKQLHILEKMWDTYPERDWYMMIDADTYLVWSNLLQWLEKLPDPSEKLYLGSIAQWEDVQFAHGGSGILMSRATLYDFAVTHNGTAASWDKPMHDECCGDYVIGKILKDNGIELKGSWPTINGENPSTIPFANKQWCEPVVTMHHVQPNHMSHIAEFERSRKDQKVSLVDCHTVPSSRRLYYKTTANPRTGAVDIC